MFLFLLLPGILMSLYVWVYLWVPVYLWLRGTPGPPPGKSPLMPRELLEPSGNSSMAPWIPPAQVRPRRKAREQAGLLTVAEDWSASFEPFSVLPWVKVKPPPSFALPICHAGGLDRACAGHLEKLGHEGQEWQDITGHSFD